MIPTHHEPLWNRIQQFEIDDRTATKKYSDKLAKENNWSAVFASRVIEEYKRFMFLCAISPTGASPSQIVDEAWHLHLTYTQNYWKAFCKEVLEKEIHHIPSKGGSIEDEHHFDWYGQTLSLYQSIFDETAPVDIWPPVTRNSPESLSLNVGEDTIKPSYLQKAWILLLPLLIPVFYNKTSPFQLIGPDFLVFYLGVIITTLVFLYHVYRFNKNKAEEFLNHYYDPKASIFQISRFMSGRIRSVQAAIVDLVERKILDVEKNGSFTFLPAAYAYSADEKNPLVQDILKTHKEGDRIRYKDISSYYNSSITEHKRLSELQVRLNIKDRWMYIALILPVICGVPRLFQAYFNEKPVFYLVFLIVISAIVFGVIYSYIKVSDLANKILTRKYEKDQVFTGFSRNSLNDFAFLGIGALGYTYMYATLSDTFGEKRRNTSDGGSCSSGDSGGSCGSSCGGGCGGCGGGD